MTRTSAPPAPSKAMKALNEVMGYYAREMTELEAVGWIKLIGDFGDDAITRFLLTHMESSPFAPKLNEAIKMLDPGRRDSTSAYEELYRAVKSCGPYIAPEFKDPALAGAVILLGGWAQVNEQMPDSPGSFEDTAYRKRFDAMYSQACSDMVFNRQVASKLRGLHDLSKPAGLLGFQAQGGAPAATEPVHVVEAIEASPSAGAMQRPRA